MAAALPVNSLGMAPPDEGRVRRRAAYLQGFSFHAAVHLHANDREGLAHLCGYGARPPFSQERLSQLPETAGSPTVSSGPSATVAARPPLALPRRLRPGSHWRREVVPPPLAASRTL